MWVCGSLFIVLGTESWPVCSWWKGWEWHVGRRPRQCLSIDPWGSQCLARYGSPLRWKPVDITHIIRTILSSYHLLRYGAGRFVRSQLDIVSYTSCSWLWSVFTHISMFEIVNVSSKLNSVSCLRLERHTCGVAENGGRGVARNRSAGRGETSDADVATLRHRGVTEAWAQCRYKMAAVRDRYREFLVENVRICDVSGCWSARTVPCDGASARQARPLCTYPWNPDVGSPYCADTS